MTRENKHGRNNLQESGLSVGSLLGFTISTIAAVYQGWTVQELCWAFWVTGLVCSWVILVLAFFRLLFTPRIAERHPQLQELLGELAKKGVSCGNGQTFIRVTALIVCLVLFFGYAYLFGFYGMFLSAFAAMEPKEYFGPNGFINSDFYGPVVYLIEQYWPMIIGTLISDWTLFSKKPALRLIVSPFETKIVRMHIAAVGMPFVSFFAWMLLGSAYQIVAVLFVLAVFYYEATPSE